MMPKKAIVTFMWNNGFRSYTPNHVNILAGAIRRFTTIPYRFVCITDETGDFAPWVETMPLPASARSLTRLDAPQGFKFPSCYRRLWLLSDEAQSLGEQVLQIDLDNVVLGDLGPVFLDHDFVGYLPDGVWGRSPMVNGSMWLVRTGVFGEYWKEFSGDPRSLIGTAKDEGWFGSDQALLSHWFHKAARWDTKALGLYGPQRTLMGHMPPKGARVCMMHGQVKPWTSDRLWLQAYCNYFGRTDALSERRESADQKRIQPQRESGNESRQATEAGGRHRLRPSAARLQA